MALDGLVVHAVVNELQRCVGSRIGKIYQPTANDLIFHIRVQGSGVRLLLSANPTYPRLHFTENRFHNPTEAPMFCMLMRKYFEGAVIESIEQDGMERVVKIAVRQRDELGDISTKTIIVEIMGRHSNIIMADPKTETILDGIHHVTPAISSHRIVLPGSVYIGPPEQGKSNPLLVTEAEFKEALLHEEAESLENAKAAEKSLVRLFSGISPLAAREIVFRSGLGGAAGTADAAVRLWASFSAVMSDVRNNRYEPCMVTDAATGKTAFSVIRLTHLNGETKTFSSPSACLEAFYGDKAERDTVKQRSADLHRFLQNEKNKNEKKLEKLHETLTEAKDADRYRVLGELLTASLHQINKGDTEAEVTDYYDEDQRTVRIELDPLLTPSENSQRFFRKYTKAKNSLDIVSGQIANAHDEIRYLDTLLQQIADASLADIQEIRDELAENGYLRDRSKKNRKKKKKEKPSLTCYKSSEGIEIVVGKNNTQNEYLTNRLAHHTDTWLHTKDIPGSHVVIRSSSFGEETLTEAAKLAAYFSQAKASSQVPVDYTQIRHVRKPNGAKPGFVIYDNQKTVYVTPDEQWVKSLTAETRS